MRALLASRERRGTTTDRSFGEERDGRYRSSIRARERGADADRAWWHFHCCCCIEWWRSANWDSVDGEHRWQGGSDSGWRSAKLSADAEAQKQAALANALLRRAQELSAARAGPVGSAAKRDLRSPGGPR